MLTVRRAESEETAIARQWPYKHVSASTEADASIEEVLVTVFSMWSAPRLYTGDRNGKLGGESMPRGYKWDKSRVQSVRAIPCGGGVEYLHRNSASRRKRRKGKSGI
jgi:hypothetical protein